MAAHASTEHIEPYFDQGTSELAVCSSRRQDAVPDIQTDKCDSIGNASLAI